MTAETSNARGLVEYEYEVWRGDAWQAGGSTTDYAAAQSEADHYAMIFGQDGPVEVRIYEKRLLNAAPPPAAARSVVDEDALRDARTIYDIACIRAEYDNATREDVEFKAICLRNYNRIAALTQQPAPPSAPVAADWITGDGLQGIKAEAHFLTQHKEEAVQRAGKRLLDRADKIIAALCQPPSAPVGVEASYHPCTSILIEGLKRLEGGSDVLAEWERARAKADTALAQQPAARPPKPTECMNGCPDRQVCDHCQWPPGPDQQPAAVDEADCIEVTDLGGSYLFRTPNGKEMFVSACTINRLAAQPGGSDNDQVPTGNKTTHERNIMNEEQRKSFENAARPLIQWLCENVHPHHTVIVTPINAELLEGSCSTGQILDFVKD